MVESMAFDENEYHKFAEKLSKNRLKTFTRMNERSKGWKQYDEPLVADIKYFGTLDGEGIRHSVYVTGCMFNCVDCYNKVIQNQNNGYPFTQSMEDEMLVKLSHPTVSGMTYVGGEPFLNTSLLNKLTVRIRKELPSKTIWSYTGFLFETLLKHGSEDQIALLQEVDVLIDGQFVAELRDESKLKDYCGSSNQRVIDVKKSLEENRTILYKS